LAVNDGNVGDNQGAFVVTLRVTRGQRESEVVRVAATVAWNDTGIDVLDGTDVYFEADGFVGWGPNRRDGAAGEEDSPVNLNRPLPHRPAAGLIGKIGESSTEYFFIGGNQNAIRMHATGRLFLGINDDYLEDNSGTLTVTVYGTVKLTLNGQAPPPMGR
jgi:hypothetical protein